MFRALPRLSRNATALGAAGAAFGAIGLLQQSNTPSRQQSSATSVGLDPKGWTPLTLTNIKKLTANTAIYRFAYSDPEATSGMSVASLLMVKAPIGSTKKDGSRANVLRPYTPITRPEQPGYLELAVKTYPDGKMSQHMASMKVGDTLDFKGPILKRAYKANEYEHIGMVAGGTGITPMLQVIDEILENPADKTKVSLLFANVSVNDILLKEQLDKRETLHPDQLKIHYVVDKLEEPSWISRTLSRPFGKSEPWSGSVGYINSQMIFEHLPPPSSNSTVFVCGPPPMYKAICGPKGTPEDPKAQGELGGLLKELGYANVFKF